MPDLELHVTAALTDAGVDQEQVALATSADDLVGLDDRGPQHLTSGPAPARHLDRTESDAALFAARDLSSWIQAAAVAGPASIEMRPGAVIVRVGRSIAGSRINRICRPPRPPQRRSTPVPWDADA